MTLSGLLIPLSVLTGCEAVNTSSGLELIQVSKAVLICVTTLFTSQYDYGQVKQGSRATVRVYHTIIQSVKEIFK